MKINTSIIRRWSVAAVFIGIGMITHSVRVTAQSQSALTEYQQCGGEDPASAFISVPTGKYDVYAKLTVKDATEQAAFFLQNFNQDNTYGDCKEIATSTVNDKNYSKVASSIDLGQSITTLYLSSATSRSMQTAAAPQIILINANTQPCTITADCKVMYKGESMNLSPQKISLSSDSLRVGLLTPISDTDTVKKVIYSIDGKPVYESKVVEPFNEKYVSGGEHTLGRRVVLESGASLSDSKVIERGTIADLNYVFQSIFFSQSKLIKIILLVVGIFILWFIATFLAKAVYKRKLWRQTHVASASSSSINSAKIGAQKNFYEESIARTVYRYRKWLIVFVCLAVGFIVFTTSIVGTFTVDGVSMLPTLQDKSIHPLVKIQKTIASINRSQYVPKRGDIVVIIKDENNLFDPTATLHKSYVVKRTVALPGERVTVKNGKIMVYNSEHKDGYEPDEAYKWTPSLAGSEQFNIDITLKDSELFVVGDHRDESIDSRFYGPIDTKEVIGKVIP